MKRILVLIVCVLTYSALSAQNNEEKNATFQLSIIPPLSTQGAHSYQYTNTISLNLLAGISKNEKAVAWAGLANIILNDAKGLQMAGLTNYVGNDGKGFQTAGMVNVNRGKFTGFQMAGLGNVAKDVNGVQLAGLVNIARNVSGVQFAGLVNIAENSDCPIGLINIIKNGEMGVAVTYDALGSTVISFRSGGKYTYGILGVGYNHKTVGHSRVAEGGLGAHIPIAPWFRLNNELKVSAIGNDSDTPVLNAGYSLLPAFKIGKHVELFAGAGINYMETKDKSNYKMFPNHSLWKKTRTTKMQQIYVGYQLGIQYIF